MSLLDGLSNLVFPKKSKRDQLVYLLSEFSDWSDHLRISLPHLSRLLRVSPEPEYIKIRKFVKNELMKWQPGEVIELQRDPTFQRIISLWPKGNKRQELPGKINIEYLQHSHLFYTYRNSLVHELRLLGHDLRAWEENRNPHYIHLTFEGREFWSLQYTATFFKTTCETILDKIERYLIDNDIDISPFIIEGNYWLEMLNR